MNYKTVYLKSWLCTGLTSYYLAPANWNSDGYRDVYSLEDIDRLPDDWDATADDCDYLGEFATRKMAIDAAKKDFAQDMRD